MTFVSKTRNFVSQMMDFAERPHGAEDDAPLTAGDISKVLCDCMEGSADRALMSAVVHHIGVEDGYVGFLHRLMATQPNETTSNGDGNSNNSSGSGANRAVIAPAPWHKKTLGAADKAPKGKFEAFDHDKEVKLSTGQPQGPASFEKQIIKRRVMDSLKSGSLKQAFKEIGQFSMEES